MEGVKLGSLICVNEFRRQLFVSPSDTMSEENVVNELSVFCGAQSIAFQYLVTFKCHCFYGDFCLPDWQTVCF